MKKGVKREVRISELPEMKQEEEILADLGNETKKFFNIPTKSELYQRNALRKINNPVVEELGRLFTRIIEVEADLEVTRYDLANIQQFNLYETFRFFDNESYGYISLCQLIKGINILLKDEISAEIAFDNSCYMRLFKRLNRKRNGALRFSEFCQCFVPSVHLYPCKDETPAFKLPLEKRKPQQYALLKPFYDYMFKKEVKVELKRFFCKCLQAEKEYETLADQFKTTLSALHC